jgi:hypothetical protein
MKLFIIILVFGLKSLAMSGSAFNAKKVEDFSKDTVQFNGQGVSGQVPAGALDYNIDYSPTDDNFLTGAKLIITSPCPDDKIKLQIVDTTGAIPLVARGSFPLYPILNEFINWYAADMDTQIPYPAKITVGLTIRASYTNTCTSSVKVRVNLHLHKILK